MNALQSGPLEHFWAPFLDGLVVNFEIALLTLVIGGVLGAVCAWLLDRGQLVGVPVNLVVGGMRAAPTFVIMFFLLNALPSDAAVSALLIVVIALVPYEAAYVCDALQDWRRQLASGNRAGNLLLLPNIARSFFVLVMSSSVGAAIGVHEGIAVILQTADKLPTLSDKSLVFAVGIVCFGAPLQLGFAALRAAQTRLVRVAA